MSEVKNDPKGRKQKLLFPILTVGGAALMAAMAAGSRLDCDGPSGQCVLNRRSVWGKSSERFHWRTVRAAHSFGSAQESYGAGVARGASGSNIVLEIEGGRSVPVMSRAVAWPIGPLKRELLEAALGKKAPEGPQWAVSFGGATWPVAFILGSVGLLFLLLGMVQPIRPNMPAAELSSARAANLRSLLIVFVAGSAVWAAIVGGLIYVLAFV